MAVTLEGGCRVSDMREGVAIEHGTLRVWTQVGRGTGAQAISLRVLEFAPGISPGIRNEECDEILYVLERQNEQENSREGTQFCTIFIDGWPLALSARTGIYLRPRQTFTVENCGDEPVVLISSRCPDPDDTSNAFVSPLTSPASSSPPSAGFVRFADRRAQPTADRWYRVLVDDEVGSTQVTQFVGSIPPGRAPVDAGQIERRDAVPVCRFHVGSGGNELAGQREIVGEGGPGPTRITYAPGIDRVGMKGLRYNAAADRRGGTPRVRRRRAWPGV